MNQDIKVFSVVPRQQNNQQYFNMLPELIEQSDRLGFDGMLLFVGNDTYIDPWMLASLVCSKAQQLSPFVAVNPVYMHPFTTAKMLSSIAHLYQRKVYINLIAGTVVGGLQALGDQVAHDARYFRLKEYAECVIALLSSTKPVNYKGDFYQLENLQLVPKVPDELLPELYLSGTSAVATSVAKSIDAKQVGILPSDLSSQFAGSGLYMGMVTRAEERASWEAATQLFPDDKAGEMILEVSMDNTDAKWKKDLFQKSAEEIEKNNGYWLAPFKRNQADCPYLVKSHADMEACVLELVEQGTRDFIIDIPYTTRELKEISQVFQSVKRRLASVGKTHSVTEKA